MHNFKKALLSMLLFGMIFAAVSAVIIHPFLNAEHGYYQDSKLRNSLAGSLDFLVIGASNSLEAMDCRVIDKQLNSNSYNLSAGLMTLDARRFFLQKEVQRNPVDTVVIDLSYQTLTRNEHDEDAAGDETALGRLESVKERWQYLWRCVDFDDWLNVYSRQFVLGLEYWMSMIKGADSCAVDYDAKGFYARPANDLTIKESEIQDRYQKIKMDLDWKEENIEKLTELISYCKDHDIRVILAVMPLPDAAVWQNQGEEEFLQIASQMASENECEFYDFNLFRGRYDCWNDQTSFFDVQHMSAEGAAAFTKVFCNVIQKAETEDVSQYFYPSYEAMKADSPYMAYLQ